MKHLQKTALQGAEETIDQLRVVEMEGVFAVVPLEEIPVEQGQGVRRHSLMELQQLG